jgi:hypothetical protein
VADNMTPIESQSAAEEAFSPSAQPARRGLGSSRTGKIAIGGILLVLVLAVAAGAFFVFFGGDSESANVNPAPAAPAANTAVAQSAPTPAPSAEVTIAPVEPQPVPLTDVFTFRDIFEPLVKAPTTTSSSGGTSGGGTTQTSANTILLQDITSENGEPMAVIVWNGTTYTVGEGDQVGTSPWQVLDIGTDSVIMLYGDVQVPLSIGQAITK